MPETLTISLDKLINSISVLENYTGGLTAQSPAQNQTAPGLQSSENNLTQNLEAQKNDFLQSYTALQTTVDKLNQFYNEMVTNHKEEIAKLSVEIARKILVQKVQDGDYEVESIIKEALSKAPAHQDLVVHLNPQDLEQCQNIIQKDAALSDLKFIADANIGRAECLLETPKGSVGSSIDENLKQIAKALTNAG
ncbi:MAG: hypothetical protein FVQ80_05745 [Planctomycetes bacterium]|nr:hypothetical protein [Planctomycetota bacterium]